MLSGITPYLRSEPAPCQTLHATNQSQAYKQRTKVAKEILEAIFMYANPLLNSINKVPTSNLLRIERISLTCAYWSIQNTVQPHGLHGCICVYSINLVGLADPFLVTSV